ncbi:hypothetical protein C8R45DRAFT_1083874 [Mycena sanguinolenta]|nr:hypothetical protein C8R45DRAFT_1083874 [Mycena sanguinolenta]
MLDGVAEVKKESNVTHKDELVLRQAKTTELQAQLKDTAELAAKALRERLEAAKALDESRKECADLQVANSALVAEGYASDKRHAAKCARLKSKIDKVKEERTNSREACSEQHAQVQSLTEKLSRAREKYERVKIEHEDLKETMREMIELVESLQRDCKAKEDLTQTISRQYDETEEARSQLEKKCVSLEARIVDLENGDGVKVVSDIAEAKEKYRQYMDDLPNPVKPPPAQSTLDPICYSSTNLHVYLSEARPNYTKASPSILMLRRLTSKQRVYPFFGFNYLAFGPTACYDRNTDMWIEGSDLAGFHGGTRELFVKIKTFILYVGTYKCHDLRSLHPPTNSPPHIVGIPPPDFHQTIIERRYPDGKIKVGATGLQCVGFNTELYEVLRRRFTDHGTNPKRKAEDGGGELKGRKSKKSRSMSSC